MKRLSFVLGIILLTIFFVSCSDDSNLSSSSSHQDFELTVESRASKDNCEELLKIFIPKTEEEISLIKKLNNVKELTEKDIEEFLEVYNIQQSSIEEFIKYLASLSCEQSILKEGGCENTLYWCLRANLSRFQYHLSIADDDGIIYGHIDIGTYTIIDSLIDFVTDSIGCISNYLDC